MSALPPTQASGKALSGKAAAARQNILSAALTLFLEHGVAATRIEDIASRAGVGKGSVYLHFETKEALFESVVAEGIASRLLQAEQFARQHTGSATDLLATLMRSNLIEFWSSDSAGIYKLVVAESAQCPQIAQNYYENITRRVRKLFEDILHLGIETGEYRQVDVPYTARILTGIIDAELIVAHSLGAHEKPSLDMDRFIDALLDLIGQGVNRPGGRKKAASQ